MKTKKKTARRTATKPHARMVKACAVLCIVLFVGFVGYALQSSGHADSGTLIFDDEFNGSAGSAPDATKWQILGGAKPYVDGQGHLVETATSNPGGVPCTNGSGLYESGGIDTGPATGGLFDFQYGSVEASIQVPCQSGTGLWPAFWSDGPNWPTGGEIDYLEIMKYFGPTDANEGLHGPTTGGSSWGLSYQNTASTWCGAYHTYGAIWSPGEIQFTIDGTVERTITPTAMQSGWTWPFDSYGQRLLLDLQIGDSGGTVDNTTLPQSMLVDWVRVYAYVVPGSGSTGTTQPPPPSTTPPAATGSSQTPITNVTAKPGTPTVSGTITAPSSSVVKVDGKTATTDGKLDTTTLTNGKHTITINDKGDEVTKSVTVDNHLTPFQSLRNHVLAAYEDSPVVAIVLLVGIVVLIGAAVVTVQNYMSFKALRKYH
jgi:beta-glucanase (GH16 family)